MSRSFGWGAVVAAALLAGSPAPAQTTVQTSRANVTFSGKLDLTEVYRDGEYFTATKGSGLAGNTGTNPFIDPGLSNAERVLGGPLVAPGVPRPHGSELYMDPNLSLRFSVEVEKQVRGMIELRTPFVNPDAGGKNTTPGVGFFSGFQERTLEVKQLYAEVDELFSPGEKEPGSGLLLRVGIQDFRKDLRGDGNAFVIDVSGSEHPFDSGPTGAPMRYSSGFADSTEAAGAYARYRVSFLDIDGWIFNLDEGFNALSLGAAARRNLYFWGGSADIFFDPERKRWGKAFFTVFDLMNQSNTHLVTEGGGLLVRPFHTEDAEILDLFGEIYFQQGTYARHVVLPAGISRIRQQDAYALNFGGEVRIPGLSMFEKKFVPYAEVTYVQVSGDDNAADDKNSNFVSLENNNRTLVVENGYYGYDVDTNYRGPRFAVGATIGKLSAEVLYAYFELMENGGNRISGGGTSGVPSSSNKIGDEIDFSIGYEYSANLHLKFTNGWLLDSHALGQLAATQISLFQVFLDF